MVAGLGVWGLAGASRTLPGPSRADDSVPDTEMELLLSHSGRRMSGPPSPGHQPCWVGAWPADFSSEEGKRVELEMTLLIPGLLEAAFQVQTLSRRYFCENEKEVFLPLGDPAYVRALTAQPRTAD